MILRHHLFSAALALASLIFGSASTRAAETPPEQSAALAKLGEAYVAAFNKGDAKAVAAFWTPDGDYVDQLGHTFAGREAIEKMFESYFASAKGAEIRVDSDSLRFLAPALAVEDGSTSVFLPDGTPPSRARYTNTFIFADGKWLLASVREAPFVAPDRSQELAGLAGLIGSWESNDKAGDKILLDVAPSPEGNFLVATRTVLRKDLPVSSGTEWIAWDPSTNAIRSWSFESDGGFGESSWKTDGTTWTVESHYTLRDGTKLREIQSLLVDTRGNLVAKTLGLSANEKDLPPPEDLIFKHPANAKP